MDDWQRQAPAQQASWQVPPVRQQRRTARIPRGDGSLFVTLTLIAVNFVCFALSHLLTQRSFAMLGASVWGLRAGRWWTLLTSMFMHSSLDHIGNNMLTLLFLGTRLEGRLGRGRYLGLYVASGIIGGLFFCLVTLFTRGASFAVGASGAIFGLFGAYGFLIWRNHMLYGRGDGSPLTEIQLGAYLFMLGENIVYGLISSNVANSAHIGGLVAGFLIMWLMVGDDLSGLRA